MALLRSNLAQRIIASAILIPLTLWIILTGGAVFSAAILLVSVIALLEFKNIILNNKSKVRNYTNLWLLFGIFYVAAPCISLLYLMDAHGSLLVIQLFICVWATDIGGYIFGKSIGGPKLAPTISPNKTWAGLIGAILFSVVFFILTTFVFYSHDTPANTLRLILAGALLAIIAQSGDLFESWIKRRFGVKDSGSIIPGHGGILDRIDGLMFAAPAAAGYIWVMQ